MPGLRAQRGFADDLAMVLNDLREALPALLPLFDKLGRVAHLHLNLPKCVFIPLWPLGHREVQDYLTQDEVAKDRTNLQQELKNWRAQRNPNVLSSSAAVIQFQALI